MKRKKHKNRKRLPQEVSIQKATGVQAKKQLGQHFLKVPEVAEKIAQTLPDIPLDVLLEIGPGTGMLTQHLLGLDTALVLIEIDSESVEYLNTHFLAEASVASKHRHRLEVVQEDVLKMDLDKRFPGATLGIIGNFPYNISSQLIFKLLRYKDKIPVFCGMFQKEVAERICAGPGSKTYGILSVLTQAFYKAEYLFTVPPEVFDPPPKVDSGVLRLTRLADSELGVEEALFFKVVKMGFNQRRKTLRNSLKSLNLSDNLKEHAIFDRRPEQLSVADFTVLCKMIAHDTL